MNRILHSHYARLVLALLFSFLLITVVLLLVWVQMTKNYHDEVQQKLHRQLAEHIVHDTDILKDGEINSAGLENAFHNMMVLGPAFEFYLLDANGKIIRHAAEPADRVKRTHVGLAPIDIFLSRSKPLPVRGDDPRDPNRQKIFTVTPVEDHTGTTLYLYIIIGGEIYDSLVAAVENSQALQLALWTLMAGMVFSLLVMLWLFSLLTRPLRVLTKNIREFRSRGFESPDFSPIHWNAAARGEIDELGGAFSEMAESVKTQYDRVKTTDELRKELLSYVSHDLRTPLASLEGYLETWQIKEGDNASESARRYIEIARNNARQISVLVEQLFELANLDSGNVQLKKEPVSIAELAQDVLQKFQLTATEKKISMEVLPRDPSLRVNADIEKLERVFTNLVDNALRHCESGDRIDIALERTLDQVNVSVMDSGSGIPDEELANIFDPHFRASNSEREGTHSGLGLAITKKLLELHQTSIQVKSQLSRGTTFSFSLSTV